MNYDDEIFNLKRTLLLQRRILVLVASIALLILTSAFVPSLLQDPEAFKITTPNGSSSPTTRVQVSGNENTAQIGVLNSNIGVGTSTQFGSGVGVFGLANATTNPSTNPTGGGVMYSEGGQLKWRRSDGSVDTMGGVSSGPSLDVRTCHGRLTLTSGTPVTTSDVTAATTVYFSPYFGNRIALYSGSAWSVYSFSERSLSLSGLAANTNFDIFIYDNSGTLTLESVAWTDATTRATSLVLQDGVYVKSGATSRRYLGTIRTTGTTGQTEDSATKRFVWNARNRVVRSLLKTLSGSHTYSSAAWRAWGNDTTARVEFVLGLSEEPVYLDFSGMVQHSSAGYGYTVGIDLDGTSTSDAPIRHGAVCPYGGVWQWICCTYNSPVALGYHYLQFMQMADNGLGTYTWYGAANYGVSGARGTIWN